MKYIAILFTALFASIFFTMPASAQVATCPSGFVLVSVSGVQHCVDPLNLVPTTAVAVPLSLANFTQGLNPTSLLEVSVDFSLDNSINLTTYREQLFVETENTFHNVTSVGFTNPSMYTLDIPSRFDVQLESGQALLCWNTQGRSITLYVNTSAGTEGFRTTPCDAVRGLTEYDEDLISYWYLMLQSEWGTRLPENFRLNL
jgi:YbbR domain-containing protein